MPTVIKYNTNNFVRFWDLLLYRSFASLKTEIAKYYLNYVWWVVEPVLSMAVYYLIFGVFLQRGTEYFVGFLLCGLTFWKWFGASVNKASLSISSNSLMYQVNINKLFFPLEVLLSDFIKQIFVVIMLLLFLIFYPTPISLTWSMLPVLILIQFLVNAAFAILCASVVPFIPDLHFVISTLLHLGFFGSGIFFNIQEAVPAQYQAILYLNPLAVMLHNYRLILIYDQWPDWGQLLYVVALSLLILYVGVKIILRYNYVYPKVCLR